MGATPDVCNLWPVARFEGRACETRPNLLPMSIWGSWSGAEEGVGLQAAAGPKPSEAGKAEPRGCVSQPGPPKAATCPGVFTSAETAGWSPRAEHFPRRGGAGRPGECERLERNGCVRAGVLAAWPPHPPLSRVRAAASAARFLGPACCSSPPPPHPVWGRSSRGGTLARPPRPPSSDWGPACVRRQLIVACPRLRPERRARRSPWCYRLFPPERVATCGAVHGPVASA